MVTFSDEELIDVFSRQLPDLLERRPELEPVIFQGFLKAFVRREELAVILDELRELRAEVDQRFEQVDQRLEKAEGATNALRAEMNQRFEQVDQRFEQVDQRFEQVDQRLEKAEGAIIALRAEMNQRFEQVDQKIEAFRNEMDQRMVDLEFGLHQAIDRLGSRWGIRNEIVFRKTIATLLEESFGVEVEQRVIEGEQFDVVIYDHQHILIEIAASVGRTIGERLERKRLLYTKSTGIEPTRIILATADIHSHRAQVLRDKGIEVIEPEEPDYSKI